MLIYLYYVKTYNLPSHSSTHRYLKKCLKIILKTILKRNKAIAYDFEKKNRDVILNQTLFENAFYFQYSSMKNLRCAIG